MRKRDSGAIHKMLVVFLVFWSVFCFCGLMTVMRAGYVNFYLEDCLTQANLAAALIDPYHYGSTGELVFESLGEVRKTFFEVLQTAMGEKKGDLGIGEEIRVSELCFYEVTGEGTASYDYNSSGHCQVERYPAGSHVKAPDGTVIESSAIYARIEVPVEVVPGVEVMAVKEHCVDIVSEGKGNE